MWELWVHLDHDHLYIPLTFKNDNFQLQTNIFPGNNSEWYFSVFLLILLLCGSRFMKKKTSTFSVWKIFAFIFIFGVEIWTFDATRSISR